MKRLLSLLLSAVLLGTLAAVPAAAEDDASARLARVTQAVKDTLDLNTDQYTDFQGECYDGELTPVWNLSWFGEDDTSLYVEALEDGTIISYRLGTGTIYSPASGNWGLPAFPAPDVTEVAARQAAEAFLGKVLSPIERADLTCPNNGDLLNRSGYTFYGTLALNGLPSPLTCSVTVTDGQVTRFRGDAAANTFLGDIPSPEAKIAQAQAAGDLRGRLAVKLEYVRDDDDPSRAILRYLPETELHTFYIDADSGDLLDITELEEALSRSYKNEYEADVAAPSAMSGGAGEDGGASLSEAELAGVDKLKDVRTAAQLDSALRAVEAYGLKDRVLAAASYSLEGDQEEETVVCALRYTQAGETMVARTITVNAKTGEVLRITSSSRWNQEPVLSQEQAQEKAEAFLRTLCPDRELDLYDARDQTEDGAPYYAFTFARKVNGCFFFPNSYSVYIDSADGSVYRLAYTWDEDMDFESPEGIVSESAALSAWAGSYDAVLAYRLVPQDLEPGDEVQDRLISQGMSCFYGLRLTYGLEREDNCLGVDARTGLLILEEKTKEVQEYADISGSAARADIEKLAKYGVGYDTDAFRPGASLTQWDFVCLLASVQGWRQDPAAASKDERDTAYSIAYELGALTRAERADSASVTRGALVKMLLNAAGYGSAARLKGIFTCSYSDQSAIPAEDLGYAAIAQALGMAEGSYLGTRTANRGEAASMLCRVLERAEYR